MDNCGKTLTIHLDVSMFYSHFKEAPGLRVKPPKVQHVRVFVQSTSYGSRCLKTGETVLYKVSQCLICLKLLIFNLLLLLLLWNNSWVVQWVTGQEIIMSCLNPLRWSEEPGRVHKIAWHCGHRGAFEGVKYLAFTAHTSRLPCLLNSFYFNNMMPFK